MVEISGDIVHQYTENQDAINFLTATEEKVKNHSEAVSLCKVLKGQILLQKMNDATAAKVIIFFFLFSLVVSPKSGMILFNSTISRIEEVY